MEATAKQFYTEIYRNIHSGAVKEWPTLTPQVTEKLVSKMTAENAASLKEINPKAINVFVKAAKGMSESEFLQFAEDPASVALKLNPAEMEILTGGHRGLTVVFGVASLVSIIGSFGLSAVGCGVALSIGNGY